MCQHLEMSSSGNSATSTVASNGCTSNWILADGALARLDAGQNSMEVFYRPVNNSREKLRLAPA